MTQAQKHPNQPDNTQPQTVRVTIDGQTIDVAAGTTLLDAAGRLGIPIPTLCHSKDLEPAASCFLCCVQIKGAKTLSPACAMPAADGMVVTTDSDDIRASRKTALELLLSDHAGDCIAPCSAACPAGLDVAAFVYEIASGQPQHSMQVIYEQLALPGSLGRICPRLCEQSCRRCDYDQQGLAIGALHRYATDHNGQSDHPFRPDAAPSSGQRVALIGAGPASLSVAFYLQQRGHACTLFDAHPLPGGMLRYGIPDYRLPRNALDEEIRLIKDLGATFRQNVRWGHDFSLAELQSQYGAIFIGIGAQKAYGLGCTGEELALSGLDLLRQVANDKTPTLGRRVVVIGGGNTAMDSARTARRLGARVQVLYRRTREEMPCLLQEAEDAETEGIEFDFLAAPVRLYRSGEALRLVVQRMRLGSPDPSGRRRPVPLSGSEFEIECDTAIAAVGQAVESDLASREGLQTTDRGVWSDGQTMATNLPGVFAGGDAVLGADIAVRAAAAGRAAALSIDQYLNGQPVTGPSQKMAIALQPLDAEELAAIFRQIEESTRVANPPLDPTPDGFTEVDPGLDDVQARLEAVRCMSCGCRQAGGCSLRQLGTEYAVDPYRFLGQRRRFEQDTSHPDIVYEPGKCILCDACVQVAARAGEELGLSAIGRGFDVRVGVPYDRPLSEGLRRVAEQCAAACPTGALALRTARSCDLARCSGLLQIEAENQTF